ncbi:MAG TPA: carboxymuconolactone decarboxylase family protein [Steroidobacteraceae bacterium]|nr:carboxymuconolactone decarboxylase family protein [Steroidobacteraceae bacterium]
MISFQQHTLDTAPAASRPLLEAARSAWGFVPTLHATLAESPVALAAYTSLFDIVGRATLDDKERQIIFLVTSVLHGCEYCVAGHTFLARKAGLTEASLQAIRSQAPIIGNAREQALRTFCEGVVRERGLVGDAAVESFIAAGFTKSNVVEVVTIVATKVISNYTNHLAHTPKESFMSDPALNWVAKKAA